MEHVVINGQGKEKGAERWEWGTYRRSVLRQRGLSNKIFKPSSRRMIDIDRVLL
jgi:hypothetical protein